MNQLRTPLAPKSGNIQPNKHLTPFQRGVILGHRLSGTLKPQIAKDLNTTLGRVKYTLSTTIYNENGDDTPRSGRPKKLTNRQRRHLIRIVRRDSKINYRQLAKQLSITIHRNTLYREIKAYGLINWLAKKRPLLIEEVAAKRLA